MILYTEKYRVPFQIDEADYEAVSRYAWHINTGGYPFTTIGKRPTQKHIGLHVFLLGPAPLGLHTDHENRDRTDNRRWNLRRVAPVVNRRNTGLQGNNTSGVAGVAWNKACGRWQAGIWIGRRRKHIGLFDTVEAAAAARTAAERELWGDAR